MGKIAIISLLGEKDKGVSIPKGKYEKTGKLHFNYFNNVDDVSIHSFLDDLKKLKLEPNEVAMDLLIIASSMYGADTRISREEYGEDSWTRIIDLYIPVSDSKLWNSHKELLAEIFKFLTGDIWNITFRDRADEKLKLCPIGKLPRYKMPYKTETVCLFSGGLDSFIGAINLLDKGITPLLVSHSKSADVSPYQDACLKAISESYPKNQPSKINAFIRIPKENLINSEDNTERGRSFLFLSLGAITASALGNKSNLIVPENGLISLNLPLNTSRAGSHSTRTTHPFYFSLMQTLFDNLKLGVTLKNPFQFKTKGEMISECSKHDLVQTTSTMSCSHPSSGRWKGQTIGHCGYCVPCIIRRSSFKKSTIKDLTSYRTNILDGSQIDITKADGADIIAFKYMINRVKKQPNYLNAAIRITGSLGNDVSQYIDVYRRGIKEVEDLLSKVKLKI